MRCKPFPGLAKLASPWAMKDFAARLTRMPTAHNGERGDEAVAAVPGLAVTVARVESLRPGLEMPLAEGGHVA